MDKIFGMEHDGTIFETSHFEHVRNQPRRQPGPKGWDTLDLDAANMADIIPLLSGLVMFSTFIEGKVAPKL